MSNIKPAVRTGELYQDVLDKLIQDFNRAVDRAIETCMLHLR